MGSQGETTQDPKAQSLASQGSSLYNLTLDEVQNQLGNLEKPLGCMSLDELLKSLWNVEATSQACALESSQLTSGLSLNRHGCLTLSGDLSKKTVDEVWRDIQQQKCTNEDRKSQERQLPPREITLEDFLVKAGVISDSNVASQQNILQHAQWMRYQHPSLREHQNHHDMMARVMTDHGVPRPLPMIVNPVLDSSCCETMVATMSPSCLISDTHSPGRKREASGDLVEKTVERKQKRMIKNRESAARSRARKQAYTHELEIIVSHLEVENERLRRQNEIEKVLRWAPPEPKHQLRRTSSAPF